MKIFGRILIVFSCICFCFLSLGAQKKVVASIEIPPSKTLYTMEYNTQGRLSELIFQKKTEPQFGSGYKITYPSTNTVVCESGGINFQQDKFDRFFSDRITLNPITGDFKVISTSYLGDEPVESSYDVTKEGIEEDNSRLMSFKWRNKSLSEINWEGDIYEFKYSERPYSFSQYGSWDWLMFVINHIILNDYLGYWYVGEPFAPFSHYPSEIINRTDNDVKKYKIDYLFMPDGNLTVDYLCEKDGETLDHSYINVNFRNL